MSNVYKTDRSQELIAGNIEFTIPILAVPGFLTPLDKLKFKEHTGAHVLDSDICLQFRLQSAFLPSVARVSSEALVLFSKKTLWTNKH